MVIGTVNIEIPFSPKNYTISGSLVIRYFSFQLTTIIASCDRDVHSTVLDIRITCIKVVLTRDVICTMPVCTTLKYRSSRCLVTKVMLGIDR